MLAGETDDGRAEVGGERAEQPADAERGSAEKSRAPAPGSADDEGGGEHPDSAERRGHVGVVGPERPAVGDLHGDRGGDVEQDHRRAHRQRRRHVRRPGGEHRERRRGGDREHRGGSALQVVSLHHGDEDHERKSDPAQSERGAEQHPSARIEVTRAASPRCVGARQAERSGDHPTSIRRRGRGVLASPTGALSPEYGPGRIPAAPVSGGWSIHDLHG